MRPLLLGGAAVGAVLVVVACLVTLHQSLAPPPPQDVGIAVVVTPLPADDDHEPMTGLCLVPQVCPQSPVNCPAAGNP